METIRMAFYKAQKGDFWGNAISGYTSIFNWNTPPYCHVEIGFSLADVYKMQADVIRKKLGLQDDYVGFVWYSSASKNTNGTTGTRWLTDKQLFEHPERWDVYEVLPERPLFSMIETCFEEEGKPYDWPGICGFVAPWSNAKNKWYCSEICHKIFFGKWRRLVSPKHLFRLVFHFLAPA